MNPANPASTAGRADEGVAAPANFPTPYPNNQRPAMVPPPIPTKPTEKSHAGRLTGLGISFFILCAMLVVGAGVLAVNLIAPGALTHQELKTLTALSALRLPGQSGAARQLCTEQGYVLLTNQMFRPAGPMFTGYAVVSEKVNPGLIDVEMVQNAADGRSRIAVRLVNQNGWKFHDVYIEEAKGRKVNLWASYLVEHPILSFMESNQEDIASGVRELREDVNAVSRLLEIIRQLNAADKQPTTTTYVPRSGQIFR